MSRRYLPGVLALVLGCAGPSVTVIPSVTVVTGVDLSRYSQKGFLFSTDPYSGPYDAMGLVTVTQYASAKWTDSGEVSGLSRWVVGQVHAQEVLDSAYARAVGLGANALVKMEIRSVALSGANPSGWHLSRAELPDLPGIQVSGFAIKRRL